MKYFDTNKWSNSKSYVIEKDRENGETRNKAQVVSPKGDTFEALLSIRVKNNANPCITNYVFLSYAALATCKVFSWRSTV